GKYFAISATQGQIVTIWEGPCATTPRVTIGSDSPALLPNDSNFKSPKGILFNENRLYVVDEGFQRVLVFEAPFQEAQSASLVIGQTAFNTLARRAASQTQMMS